VAAFELETYHFLENLVEENNIPCDWVSFSGVHTALTQDVFDLATTAVKSLKLQHPDLGSQVDIADEDTLASLRVAAVKGAIVQKHAASLWPYKLVVWVLEELLATFPAPSFNLQTNTPVTDLKQRSDGAGWTLTTSRGRITAKTVLLCTNGYTSRLLPSFSDLIVPVRGQIAAILPPRRSSTEMPAKLQHSYLFSGNYPPRFREDYLVQRPLPAGELIFGGGRFMAEGLGVGEWRDDAIEESVSTHLRGKLSPPLDLTPGTPHTNHHQSQEPDGVLLHASYEWTGVMGYSRDSRPWVGAVPENLGGGGVNGGLWICGGYTGHGMPVAALAAREVVKHMTGSDDASPRHVRFPEQWRLTEARVESARKELMTLREQEEAGMCGSHGLPAEQDLGTKVIEG
jgi:glycine/D-amino acid oxidase-like deaminating enzyme